MYDVVIIGAGVIGCAIARELARYDIKICVAERCEDVCCGTSKANSAIVHGGFDAKPGSWKARLNVEGSRRMERLCEELDVPFRRNGSLVVCMEESRLAELTKLYERGQKNGVKGLRILSGEEALAMEPGLSEETKGALYAPTGGIVCPFELTIALAENAAANKAEFRLGTKITGIRRDGEGYVLSIESLLPDGTCGSGEIKSRYVVNAAGVYADEIHNMVSAQKLAITPRRGEYCLLDKESGALVSHTVFTLPGKLGKGVLVTPTVHGNLLVGPTAEDIEDKEGIETTEAGLESLLERGSVQVKGLRKDQIITSFAGLRACEQGGDFVIGEVLDAPGFFDAAGVASPGLTAAPAIGAYMAELLGEGKPWRKREDFLAERKGIRHFAELSIEEQNALILENPAYGRMVCRCEKITEGEILEAICRPLGARTLEGLSRRVRTGFGRCQGGFCSPRIMELLSRELSTEMEKLTKMGGRSYLTAGPTRGGEDV